MNSDDSGEAHGKRRAQLGSAETAVGPRAGSNERDALADTSRLPARGFVRGDELAHFVVLGQLGEGGMGVVYAAYDPKLDRKVAIKLLRPDRDEPEIEGRKRLLREAQAMAKLSHEHVVTVHEVGEVYGRVFVAMEYVAGGTLRDWMQQQTHSWQSIVSMFARAGRGLAAAHHQDLVHRDFKPENVLVGDDGRVRVTDFGLVGHTDGAGDIDVPPAARARADTQQPLSGNLTEHGVVLGTPGFIAPEVYRGERADAGSDQFSFCVALYEALYGDKPFLGDTAAEISISVATGERRTPPATSDVPGWLFALVDRGLSVDPAQRHSSMDELLSALTLDRGARRSTRRVWAAGGLGALLATGVVALLLARGGRSDPPPCTGAADTIESVWGTAPRETLTRAFRATSAPFAADAALGVAKALDNYTATWAAMHTTACRKTRVDGTQSEALLDLRMRCLERRRDELKALLDVLTSDVDAKVVEHSTNAVQQLVEVAACADTDALTAAVPPPERRDLRKRVAELEVDLTRVTALSNAGKPKEALSLARTVVARARTVGWPHFTARALYRYSRQLDDAGDAKTAEQELVSALPLAAAARDDRLVARIYISQLRLVGYARSDFARAMQLRHSAHAAVARAGSPPNLEASYALSLGAVYDAKGRYREALALYKRAQTLYQANAGRAHPDTATAMNDVAVVLDLLGDHDAALATYERVLAVETEAHGKHHPRVARTLNNMAITYAGKERYDEALRNYSRAVTIWRRAYGDKHAMLAITYVNMAVALEGKKDYAESARRYHQALDLWKDAQGRQRAHVATVLNNLGDLYEAQGKCGDALPYYRRSFALYQAVYPKEHPDWAYPLMGLGTCLTITGHATEGLRHAEQALQIRTQHKVDTTDIAEAEFALARVLWHTPAQRARARRLARSSRARYVDAGDDKTEDYRDLVAWMAKRRISPTPP